MAKQALNLDELKFLENNQFNIDENYSLFKRLYSENKIKLITTRIYFDFICSESYGCFIF